MMSSPLVLTSVACPVEGFLSRDQKPARIREHFMYIHSKAQV